HELDVLYKRGVVFPRDFKTREGYRFARAATQLHDASQSLLGLSIYSPEQEKRFFQLWEDFCHKEWDPDKAAQWKVQEQPRSRVVPAYKSLEGCSGVLPCEDMRELFKTASLITVTSCSCRKRREVVASHCEKSHDVNCFQFGRSAEYSLNRGHGRKLPLDEAVALLGETEDDGLVHFWTNTTTMTSSTMCSCCIDCCMNMAPMSRYQVPWTRVYAKSRWEPKVNQEACSGCQDCIERCQFDAITLEKFPGSKKFKVVVDPEKCMGCGLCVIACEEHALTMAAVRPPEFIPQAA
ncbi:MAG: 4Fe-4S binding protein, partial [Chloroflexota bacterium]|nr:4Fe-4S binding protein [Chloroflexota bacterium]